MKRILVATVTVVLFATAAVKAAPTMPMFADRNATSLAETAQYRTKGKGKRFKKGFKKGLKKGGKKGPHCFSKCAAKGNPGPMCNMRCR